MAGSGWTHAETSGLISIWGESTMQQALIGCIRNRTVFEKVSNGLAELGWERSWTQCRTMVKNQTSRYRKVKDINRKSGEGTATCPFYEELNEILGTRAASDPVILIDSAVTSNKTTPPMLTIDDLPIVESEEEELQVRSRVTESPQQPDVASPVPDRSSSATDSSSTLATGTTSSSVTSSLPECNPSKKSSEMRKFVPFSGERGRKSKQGRSEVTEMLFHLGEMEKAAEERAEEREYKRRKFEAEMEERRREAEMRHEERMMLMFSTFTQQMLGRPSGMPTYTQHSESIDDSYTSD